MWFLDRHPKTWIPRVPKEHVVRFRSEVCYQNMVRMRIMVWVNTGIMVILLILQSIATADHELATGATTYAILRGTNVVLCLLYLLGSGRPRSAEEVQPRHYWVIFGFTTAMFVFAAVWVGLSQQWINSITYYLIIVFVLASFIDLPPQASGSALGIGLVVLILMMFRWQADPLVQVHNIVNGSVLTVMAFCIGQLGWWSHVQRFLDRVTIEQQAVELQRLSLEDDLTGLGNRRQAEAKLTEEAARSHRSGEPLSLIMMDVDRFKAFNDTYGHSQGDEVLRSVGRTLANQLKCSEDMVTRYGGEEFLVFLVNTDLSSAHRIANDSKKAVWDLNIPHSGSEHGRVTISLGIATAEQHHACPGALVDAADRALYVAKASGRNCSAAA